MGGRRDSCSGVMEVESQVHDLDDDGKPRRTGTIWTASAHIITAVIGSGVLSLSWAIAQLGWVAGPGALVLFAVVTYFTSTLLADCYRYPDPVSGKRNYTYKDAVRVSLGEIRYTICGIIQYLNLFGIGISYVITSAISMVAIKKSSCFHYRGHQASCTTLNNPYMISFGIVQVLLSQIPNFHNLSWLSKIAATMSFVYAFIGVGLSTARIVSGNSGKSTLGGVEVGPNLSEVDKAWKAASALGDIAFTCSFSLIFLEVQDTLRSPAENKKMKKATLISTFTTTSVYLICGCVGYAAFGNNAPGNMLTGFGFYEPFWLIDIANVCIVVHLLGAFQVVSQPLFAIPEMWASKRWQDSELINRVYTINIRWTKLKYEINLFRFGLRTFFVVLMTMSAMAMPFFNDILALIGGIGYWPLTVYFPIEMYITQKKIKRSSIKWFGLQILNLSCLIVALVAVSGSVRGMSKAFHVDKPFNSKQ